MVTVDSDKTMIRLTSSCSFHDQTAGGSVIESNNNTEPPIPPSNLQKTNILIDLQWQWSRIANDSLCDEGTVPRVCE